MNEIWIIAAYLACGFCEQELSLRLMKEDVKCQKLMVKNTHTPSREWLRQKGPRQKRNLRRRCLGR